MQKIESFYFKHYKKILWIPIIMTIISLILIVNQYNSTGNIFKMDVSLKGGISSSVYTEKFVELSDIENELGVDSSVRRLTDFSTGKQLGYIIEVSDLKEDELKDKLQKVLGIELNDENFSVEETGEKLGKSFYSQLMVALGFAFLLMAITVFITFRTFIPSIAVIQAAVGDIIITLAIVNIIGIKISSAGIVAFLLIVGYSIDTDILLTTRILKRSGGRLFDRMVGSMKTGLTMTITTIVAVTAGYFLTQSFVLKDMFLILIIALFMDIITTYMTNAGIMTWYHQKKFGKDEQN